MTTATTNQTGASSLGKSIKMTDAQFERLHKIIYDRSGIHFAESKKYIIESRLGHRLQELEVDNFDQYIALLTMGPYQADEFQEMFNRITINETSFFRNDKQLEIFEAQYLADIIKARSATKRLRIWSAACSTGEEPYTIAIQLHRSLGIRMADWKIEILGTDISEKVLKTAQAGQYTSYSMRGADPTVINRYFDVNSALFEINPEIKSMVSFEKLNLKDTLSAKRHGTFDVIFCRNVMIYFDDVMRKQCFKMFNEMLADDGALLIGHSETIRETTYFTPRPELQAFAYEKTKE
jgi:chemotaxis protein methyltransferase CheR